MARVLIVDDYAPNLHLLGAQLRSRGHQVEEARDGAEALFKARLAPPELVLSDLLMPVMDGYALLRHWRADDALKSIPFIIHSSSCDDPKDARLALALGADAFIPKPSDPALLATRVDEVLSGALRGGLPSTSGIDLLAEHIEVLTRKLGQRTDQLAQADRERRESDERFRATFEQPAVGLLHVGLDGRLLRVNQKLCDIAGYPREEMQALSIFDLVLPEDRPDVESRRELMLAGTHESLSKERRYRKKDGSEIWVNVALSLQRDAAGEAKYFVAVVTDISHRKRLQEQLDQAQKLDAIGQLTGGIAHDFNNLLTVILGNADLLVDGLAHSAHGDDLRALAEMVRTAARRGADLTQRLLAFARRQALEPHVLDVNGVLSGMDPMLQRTLPAHIDIEFALDAKPWLAMVDPVQLEAAVLNLAINARDAMPQGGRLTIETSNVRLDEDYASQRREVSAGEYLLVAVSDTGTGIAPEVLPQVFDPFFSTKPVGKGTGLGLSMVYGFAKQSRGHLSIYSELGHGTTVKLYLPRASGAEQAAAESAAESAVEAEPVALAAGESVLLVEDDELVRRYAEQQLRSLGYRVFTAADGASALALVESGHPVDLLLTDIVMPGGMNGRELANAAVATRPRLKVLFSSGYTENAIVHHGRLDQGVHLLNKPYGRLELATKVRAALADSDAEDAGGAPPTARRLLILDDDPLVGKLLTLAARNVGLPAELTSKPEDFFDQFVRLRPSHVVVDLAMPRMGGLEVLERLAQLGCRARVLICSGADALQMKGALDHARGLGLDVAGTLPKPFSLSMLQSLLAEGSAPAPAPAPGPAS